MGTESRSSNHGPARVCEHAVLAEQSPASIEAFTFDGRKVEGRRGEPLAAALLAAGVRVFRTMPRFGDPRGGYCMVGRCADCLVTVNGIPSVRACVTALTSGLDVRTQNGLGEVGAASKVTEEDVGA